MADAFAVNVANVITHDRALARARASRSTGPARPPEMRWISSSGRHRRSRAQLRSR